MGNCFPQGSVLGLLLYIIYTSELGSLLAAQSVLGQLYADNIQVYLHCLASNAIAAVRAMTLATGALVTLMSSNRLWLNPSKTQYIWMGTRQQLAKLDLSAIAARFPHKILLSSQLLFEIWESHWIRSLPLLPTLIACAVTATTGCGSSASSPARSLLLLLLHLSMPLSQLDLTTALRSTLVSLPYA